MDALGPFDFGWFCCTVDMAGNGLKVLPIRFFRIALEEFRGGFNALRVIALVVRGIG